MILFSNANNGSNLTYFVNFDAGQLTVFERWVNRENQSDIFALKFPVNYSLLFLVGSVYFDITITDTFEQTLGIAVPSLADLSHLAKCV